MHYFYGGAFNPMTKAHLQIIESIFSEMKKDDKLIIGITEHDYKTYEFDYNLRSTIVFENLIKLKNTNFLIIKQNQRTWKFLNENEYMKSISPVTLVMGEDEYNDLKSLKIWQYSKEILDNFPIKVFSRSYETKDISATKVRELLKNNASFLDLKKYITDKTYEILKG